MKTELFFQNIINGLSLGSLYALIAVGYTMVYGILRLINFAHGDIFMLGAYFIFYFTAVLKLNVFISIVMGIVGCGIVGVMIDRIAYRPLRNAPRVSSLITAIGVSFFIESFGTVVFSGIPKSYREVYPLFFENILFIGKIRVNMVSVITLVSVCIIFFSVWLLVYKTRFGIAMRAVSTDISTVSLMGINVDRIIGTTFFIGSALACIGAFLWASRYPQINPYMGFTPGIKAFTAAVLGGIGSVTGAAVGGLLLGLIEVLIVGFFPWISGFKDAFAFLILILILSFKPAGLFGRKEIVKV